MRECSCRDIERPMLSTSSGVHALTLHKEEKTLIDTTVDFLAAKLASAVEGVYAHERERERAGFFAWTPRKGT
jgi:hypothetical protein